MHKFKAVVCSLAFLILTGCGDSEPKQVEKKNYITLSDMTDARTYFDQQLEGILTQAKSLNDPYDAYSLLVKAYYGVDKDHNRIVYTSPSTNMIIRQSNFTIKENISDAHGSSVYTFNLIRKYDGLKALFDYLDAALATGNKQAFLELYTTKQDQYDKSSIAKVEALQMKYSKEFATLAESSKVGETVDNDLILLYAYQLSKGLVYPKNSEHAVEFYSKLYPSDNIIPFHIMSVYLGINDFENAYFWKLRCVGICANSLNELNDKSIGRMGLKIETVFSEMLTSGQFKAIEAAASDPARMSFK